MVLMPHIGLVLQLDDWMAMAERLQAHGVKFDIPRCALPGSAG